MSIKHNKELGYRLEDAEAQLCSLGYALEGIIHFSKNDGDSKTENLFDKADKLVRDLDDSLADMKYHLDKMEEDFAEAEKLLKEMQK